MKIRYTLIAIAAIIIGVVLFKRCMRQSGEHGDPVNPPPPPPILPYKP